MEQFRDGDRALVLVAMYRARESDRRAIRAARRDTRRRAGSAGGEVDGHDLTACRARHPIG